MVLIFKPLSLSSESLDEFLHSWRQFEKHIWWNLHDNCAGVPFNVRPPPALPATNPSIWGEAPGQRWPNSSSNFPKNAETNRTKLFYRTQLVVVARYLGTMTYTESRIFISHWSSRSFITHFSFFARKAWKWTHVRIVNLSFSFSLLPYIQSHKMEISRRSLLHFGCCCWWWWF